MPTSSCVVIASSALTSSPYCSLPVPPTEAIIGDPVRLRQVFVQLLNNAIKYTRAGFVRVVVRASPAPAPPQSQAPCADTSPRSPSLPPSPAAPSSSAPIPVRPLLASPMLSEYARTLPEHDSDVDTVKRRRCEQQSPLHSEHKAPQVEQTPQQGEHQTAQQGEPRNGTEVDSVMFVESDAMSHGHGDERSSRGDSITTHLLSTSQPPPILLHLVPSPTPLPTEPPSPIPGPASPSAHAPPTAPDARRPSSTAATSVTSSPSTPPELHLPLLGQRSPGVSVAPAVVSSPVSPSAAAPSAETASVIAFDEIPPPSPQPLTRGAQNHGHASPSRCEQSLMPPPPPPSPPQPPPPPPPPASPEPPPLTHPSTLAMTRYPEVTSPSSPTTAEALLPGGLRSTALLSRSHPHLCAGPAATAPRRRSAHPMATPQPPSPFKAYQPYQPQPRPTPPQTAATQTAPTVESSETAPPIWATEAVPSIQVASGFPFETPPGGRVCPFTCHAS